MTWQSFHGMMCEHVDVFTFWHCVPAVGSTITPKPSICLEVVGQLCTSRCADPGVRWVTGPACCPPTQEPELEG